jgi:F-box/leucine-rich repeat protein 2/20
MDLGPFASHLRPQTIRRIVDSSRDFIIELSLRGMDALCARDLMPAIVGSSVTREAPYGLPNLTSLDLRGCKSLDPETIQALICAAPKLRSINLKGVQAVTSEVAREMARSSKYLESLDVSRCWNISLCDICVFLRTITKDQAASIKVLRVGGLKAYGTAAADILPLVMERLINLETLDLLGNTHIRDADISRACECLESRPIPSPLQHLVLSGCTSLSSSIFLSMHSLFSNLTRLELASLPEMFDENGQGDKGFHKFLVTLPNLEKLDLEGTGVKGGVNDKMLEALSCRKGGISRLTDLQIGWAKGVTPEGMIRFIRATPSLRVFVADVSAMPGELDAELIIRIPPPQMESCENFTAATETTDRFL